MKSIVIFILTFYCVVYVIAQSNGTDTGSKSGECVCKESDKPSGLPFDPCNSFPSYLCAILSESCTWNESKCVFKYPMGRNNVYVEPFLLPATTVMAADESKNSTDTFMDPCRRSPSWACLILREVCVFDEIRKVCQFRWSQPKP